jgi:hypothetical protein
MKEEIFKKMETDKEFERRIASITERFRDWKKIA